MFTVQSLLLLLFQLITTINATQQYYNNTRLDVRVTRALGPKGYNKMRLSVITHGPATFADINFTYSSKFQYRWTKWPDSERNRNQPNVPERWLHSKLIDIPLNPDSSTGKCTLNLTVAGHAISIELPPIGTGSKGIIISDPCFKPPKGIQSWIDCKWSKPWKTFNRLTRLLESTVGATNKAFEVDYFSILGDNFYDQNGAISDVFFHNLSLNVKRKPLSMVIGNHDMWIEGGPSDGDNYDQHGNGMMQYYALDTAASISPVVIAQNNGTFLDFSVDPDQVEQWNGTLNTASNLIWYNFIGDVAYIGVSGAFNESELAPHLDRACDWLGTVQTDVKWVFLLGHWDQETSQEGEQCDPCPGMSTPDVYQRLRKTSGCQKYGNRLKYMDGHTHCNYIQEVDKSVPNGETLGYMIGGSGMSGCGQFGFEYVDSTNGEMKIYYFELENENRSRSEEILNCLESKGVSNCTELATVWH